MSLHNTLEVNQEKEEMEQTKDITLRREGEIEEPQEVEEV